MMRLKSLAGALMLLAGIALAEPVSTPIKFARGKSSKTIESAVVRGDRHFYTFEAKAKQSLSLKITSIENNAAFDLYAPGAKIERADGYYDIHGKVLAEERMTHKGALPQTGKYLIVVGGTRGNATYKLTVAIR